MNGRRDYNTKSDKDKHHMISHKKIMNGRRDYNAKSDKDKHHMISFMWDTQELTYKTDLQTQTTCDCQMGNRGKG